MSEPNFSRDEQRRRDGTVKKGNTLRASSFAKRARGLARLIGYETKNGEELIHLALGIARNPNHKDQWKAIDGLVRRFAGKEPEAIDLSVTSPDGSVVSPLAGVSIADVLALAKQAPAKDE